jgi:hypothetical protein
LFPLLPGPRRFAHELERKEGRQICGQSISTEGTNMTQGEKNAFAEALARVIRQAFGVKGGH